MAQNISDENPRSLLAEICIVAFNDLQISYTIVLLVMNALLSIITSLGIGAPSALEASVSMFGLN